jgi:hypothetical protein
VMPLAIVYANVSMYFTPRAVGDLNACTGEIHAILISISLESPGSIPFGHDGLPQHLPRPS